MSSDLAVDPASAAPPAVPPLSLLDGVELSPSSERDFALPVIVSRLGSVQVAWGPTGIQQWVMAPTGMASTIGRLYRMTDGRAEPVAWPGTSYRWRPFQVERRHPVVDATTTLDADQPCVVESLTFNDGGTFGLLFGGLCRTWHFDSYWNLPSDDVPQYNARWEDERVVLDDNKTYGRAEIGFSRKPARVRAFASVDDLRSGVETVGRGRFVLVEFDLGAGERLEWRGVQGTAERLPVEVATAAGSGRNLRDYWESVWRDAFTPGNRTFSGHLPTGPTDPELARLYAMGVYALLCARRENQPPTRRDLVATGGQAISTGSADPMPVAYVYGGTEGASTTCFYWEIMLQAPLLARLDPAVLRQLLERALRNGTDRAWGFDTRTGRPAGVWYGANEGAVFASAVDYLRHTGDLAWLDTDCGGRSVREALLDLVDRHTAADVDGLRDYGTAENLLECVGTYEGKVAAFNAQAVWMHRRAAELLAPERAAELLERAQVTSDAVRRLMTPGGWFVCRTKTGDVEVKTSLDFVYVGRYLAEDLTADEKARMTGFFVSELETTDWMRALALSDANAMDPSLPAFQRYRADHQATGSYDGWPALSAAVRWTFGDRDRTLSWLRRIAATTAEGPFGQARLAEPAPTDTAVDWPSRARKASFFNGNAYLESCGCAFAHVLLDTIAPAR